MTAPRTKCNAKKGKWCKAVEEVFQFHDPVSKGLLVNDVINTKDYSKGHGLSYRPKANAKQFYWLNFCPFCGANVEERT